MNAQDAALFALDAYPRFTAPLGFPKPFDAKVIDQTVEGAFAAVAYYLPGTNEVVFAYRGTDDQLSDALTGWPLGSGWYNAPQSQADLAFGFFNDVLNAISDPAHEYHHASSADVVLTGHSLGGGLAGLVASVNGLPAYVFDSMPFAEAANNLYADVSGPDAANHSYWSSLAYPGGVTNPPSFSQITSYAIEDEVNSNLRYGTPFVVADHDVIVTSGLDSQIIQQNEIRAGAVENIIDLHSQALLTIALHGGLQHSAQREAGGEAIYHHLFDASLSSHLGFADTELLRRHLAYSTDHDVVGLDSLFADMDVLGTIVQSFTPNAHLTALGKLAIVHASAIASTGDSSLRMGLIDAVGGAANIALSGTIGATELIQDFLEFSSSVLDGEFFDIPTTTVSNLAVSMSGYGEEVHLASGGTMYFGTSYLDDIYGSQDDDVILSLGTDGIFHDTIRGGGGNDVIYASAGADTIHDGSGNDRAHGGSGNDTFHSSTGSDAMFGEAGNDTFHLGEAEEGDVDYVNGGAHTGTGDVVEVSVGATYRLDAVGAAAIRNQIVANGFAAPTGHGIGIEMAVGDAFVQGVEIVKASSGENEVILSTWGDLSAAGVQTLDFTAGAQDVVNFTGAGIANLTLTGSAGQTKAVFTGKTTPVFLGVDEWNLTSAADVAHVDISHLSTQVVTINGGEGTDTLHLSTFEDDIVFGLEDAVGGTNIIATGFERVYAGSGDNIFYGYEASEFFYGGTGLNTFYGSLGADILASSGNIVVDYSASKRPVMFTSQGSTRWAYGSNNDPLSFGAGDEIRANGTSVIAGTAGADTLVVVGLSGTLHSNGGNDRLNGRENDDILNGADGYAEIMSPGDGNDVINFGTGGGELNFSTSSWAASIDLEASTFVFGSQFDTVTGSFEKLVGTKFGDTIHGSDDADSINGGTGIYNDVVYGRGGDDKITISRGEAHGGGGNDTISVGQNAFAYGDDDDDTITADQGSTVFGGAGIDTITTSSTGVTIHGGTGGDIITINQTTSSSTLSYELSDAAVTILGTSGSNFLGYGGHAEGDQISGSFTLVGSDFSDTFDYRVLRGTTVHGGGGDDIISVRYNSGGAVHGGDDSDTITLFGGETGYGDDGDDTFYGRGTMHGGIGDDDFFLGGGSVVWGGTGQNHIEGSTGNDLVYMSEGSDTFVYFDAGAQDTIHGAGADDHFVLNGVSGFNSLSDVAANLFEMSGNTELRLDDTDHKISFVGLTASQVIALDWAFA